MPPTEPPCERAMVDQDDEVDHRLGDHPEHVEVLRDAVLKLSRDRRAHRRQVEVEDRAHARRLRKLQLGAHSGLSCAKTSSITSSIGGSSIVRSATSYSLKVRAAMRGVSGLGTRNVTRSPSRLTTSPIPSRRSAPFCSATSIVLYAAKRCESAARSPSNRIRPWWMTITRRQRATTSAM